MRYHEHQCHPGSGTDRAVSVFGISATHRRVACKAFLTEIRGDWDWLNSWPNFPTWNTGSGCYAGCGHAKMLPHFAAFFAGWLCCKVFGIFHVHCYPFMRELERDDQPKLLRFVNSEECTVSVWFFPLESSCCIFCCWFSLSKGLGGGKEVHDLLLMVQKIKADVTCVTSSGWYVCIL